MVMPKVNQHPKGLRPFIFHGVDLQHSPGDEQGKGDCPLCGREGKFSVNLESGLWDCKVCGESGNPVKFLQRLWEESATTEEQLSQLASEKDVLDPATLLKWGVRVSASSGEWIIPGWGVGGKVTQLYRWTVLGSGKSLMLPTPKVDSEQEHGLFGLNLFDRKRREVYICEGPWDGMVLWELLRFKANVIAVPGCNVFLPSWLSVLKDREVSFMYDNDHPLVHPKTGKRQDPGAWRAVKELSAALIGEGHDPSTIRHLRWADGEFDPEDADTDHNPNLPHGFDVRDFFKASHSLKGRKELLPELLENVVAVPDQWSKEVNEKKESGTRTLECSSWVELEKTWSHAMHWREELGDVLSVMMAVAASTEFPGDQLFLQVIAPAGSGKTRFCEAMITSPKCYALEHLTGFHSGWKDKEGNDYSLLGRINFKTLITSEGDTLLSSPHFAEIMSQQRRIFDGSSVASYKNQKEDKTYTGLRTPWIFVGTPVLMSQDQSRLGDRFLRAFITKASLEEERRIVHSSGSTQLRGLLGACPSENGRGDIGKAYGMTGGYVNWLRKNVEERMKALKVDRGKLVEDCSLLAEFVADLRARPDPSLKRGADKESAATKELPTRLVQQLVRLTCCLCVVLNKESPDEDVMRRVRKVAIDTSRGRMLNIVAHLHRRGPGGASTEWVATMLGEGNASIRDALRFLKSIDVVRSFVHKSKSGLREMPRWALTERMQELCEIVLKHSDF